MLLCAYLVGFTHPPLNVRVEISFGVYTERVANKVRRVLFVFEEARIIIDPWQRKSAKQMRLARIAPAEPDSNLKHDASFLCDWPHLRIIISANLSNSLGT